MQIVRSEKVILEQHERYQKSGYRNKYRVLAANGPLLQSIPIVGGRGSKEWIRDVKIDYSTNWQKQHWRTLESAYNKSAFFLYYKDFLEKLIMEYNPRYLWDFNWEAIHWINSVLKTGCQFHLTETFEKERVAFPFLDYRGKEKAGVNPNHDFPVYFQVFGNIFFPNLCILDMLFNLGASTRQELEAHA